MKPLLRAVLIVDALLLAVFGLLFVLTPWASLYQALQLVQTDPVLVGQSFGVTLIGLAWLAVHASFDGALTSKVSKVIGHVNWLTGLVMLVWLLGLHKPSLSPFGQLVAASTGVVLVVLGFGNVRLAGAVRKRERERAADNVAVARDARRIDKDADRVAVKDREDRERVAATGSAPVYRPAPVVHAPMHPAMRPVGEPVTDPAPHAVDARVEPGLSGTSPPVAADGTRKQPPLHG